MLLRHAWIVFVKEMRDSLRDRRTLFVVLLSSVALGPVLLFALGQLIDSMDRRASERVVWVVGAQHGPTLVNYLQRQAVNVVAAPADHERRIGREGAGEAVLVIGEGFEAALEAGRAAPVTIVASSADARSQASASRIRQWMAGFAGEQATLRLAARGVAAGLVQPLQVQDRDLADRAARGASFAAMLPFFVVMAVLYGALHAALDSTAGERERGSLEPLMMNPAAPLAVALGKWAAVAAVALGVGALASLSFLPAQRWLGSETLAAMLRFGPREALWFIALLSPLALALAALLLAVAIRCRTFKEAQANASIVLLVLSLLPLVSWFNQGAEVGWHLHVPVLAEVTLMNRVLRAEPLALRDLLVAGAMAAAVTALSLAWVAARLRAAAIAAR